MSNDIVEPENVGLRLSPQIIAKIDERRTITGQSRQEVIRQVLITGLFESC